MLMLQAQRQPAMQMNSPRRSFERLCLHLWVTRADGDVALQVESLMALLSQLSSLVQSQGGIKAKQWGKVTALLAKDTSKVLSATWGVEVGSRKHGSYH